MYIQHFALTHYPFEHSIHGEDLFASATGQEAEARLKHLLQLRGIGLVTGEAGSGKTTLCRKVAGSLHTGLYRVFYIPLSTGNVMDRGLSPSPGSWACRPSAIAPAPFALSARKSPACAWRPSSCRCSSSMRPITCAMTCWRTCVC